MVICISSSLYNNILHIFIAEIINIISVYDYSFLILLYLAVSIDCVINYI